MDGLHYLWGIETISHSHNNKFHLIWITLPMRDWDPSSNPYFFLLFSRITLPMRDWDKREKVDSFIIIKKDYITYEGLRQLNKFFLYIMYLHRGLHYLWGIETYIETISIIFTEHTWITLPMRDWDDCCDYHIIIVFICTGLHYLWGIETLCI